MDLIQQLTNEYGVPGCIAIVTTIPLAIELLVSHYKPTLTRKDT